MKIIFLDDKDTEVIRVKASEDLTEVLETLINMLRLYGYPYLDFKLAIEHLEALQAELGD